MSDVADQTTKLATWHAPPNVPCILADVTGELIGSAAIKGMSPQQQMANARLMAAAPAMLALLTESQDSIGGDWRERRDALLRRIAP